MTKGVHSEHLRICSYNIHKSVGFDRVRRPDRILEVLHETGADIAVLQEVDRRMGERRSTLPHGLIAEHGWRVVPVADRPAAIGWHGNAILVSRRVDIVRSARVPLPALEPRGAVLADLEVAGKPLRVIGAHLDLSGLWRPRQVRALAGHIDGQDEALPTLVVGDFNEWRLDPPALHGLSRPLEVLRLGPSFPARWPVAWLDRMFATADLRVAEAEVHHSRLASEASDHLPVKVRLHWGSKVAGEGEG